MTYKFWKTMTWIDEHVSHPIWDLLTPKDNSGMFLDGVFFRFCQWSNIGLYNYEEKHNLLTQ